MHVIYLVRRGCKYHTNQSHRILLTRYFFYHREGAAFWSLAPSSTMGYYATAVVRTRKHCRSTDLSVTYVDALFIYLFSSSTSYAIEYDTIRYDILFALKKQKYKQWHRNTNKEHTGRKANAGLTNHLCPAKKNKRIHKTIEINYNFPREARIWKIKSSKHRLKHRQIIFQDQSSG